MNNTGDSKVFTISGTQTSGLTYVWKFWDGSVEATTVPYVQKTLNMGGDPRYGGTLAVDVEVVDALGQSGVYQTSIVVNNPPQVSLGTALATVNGSIISFDTVLQADVYDLEGHTMAPSWSESGVAFGAGTSLYIGNVDAYWNGTLVGLASGTRYSLPYTVDGSTNLSLRVVDSFGGAMELEFPIYGFGRSDTYFSPTAGPESQTGDASSQPVVTVGENATFTVYSNTGDRVVFVWGFWGTNGWTLPTSGNGDTATLPDGTIRNTQIKDTVGEHPGNKLAEVTIIDLDHITSSTVTVPVTIVDNDAPQAVSYEMSPTAPTAGLYIRFSASYTDPNRDLVTTKWTFSTPSVILWGRTVWLDTVGMSAGNTVTGKFEVIDRLGATDELNFSIILV